MPSLRRKREAEAPPAPTQQVIDVPIMPTEVSIGRLDTPGGAYAILTCATMLTSATFVMDRGQTVKVAAELMKMAEKMPREKKLEVPGGLVIPG